MLKLFPIANSEQWSGVILRIGLVAAGCLLIQTMFTAMYFAPLTQQPVYVPLTAAFGLVGLLLLVCAGLKQPPRWLMWMILAALIAKFILGAIIWVENTRTDKYWFLTERSGLESYDNGIMTQLAGQLVIHGYNPYTWDVTGIYDIYRASQFASSPQLNGSDGKSYPYPAFIFLVNVPLQLLGLPGAFLASCAAYIGLVGLLFVAASREIRPLILLPFMLTDAFQTSAFAGNQDIIWTLLIVGMVLGWRRRWLRALLYGLAVASKQPPWLLAPFLAIKIWREEGWREVVRFFSVTGALFFGINAPFMLMDMRAWLVGTFQPLVDQMVYINFGGLSEINQSGYAMLPRGYYTAATLIVLALTIVVYWRHYPMLRRTLYWMPALVMWFAYRSLIFYWYYWLFPAAAALLVLELPLPDMRTSNWRLTAGLVGAAAAFMTIMGVVLSAQNGVQVQALPPFLVDPSGRVQALTVEVRNNSAQTLSPRFQVRINGTSMMPWMIEDGPLTMDAGSTANYQISSQRSDRTFFNFQPAALFLTDAGGDYDLIADYPMPLDKSSLWPDAVANPTYRFWSEDGSTPVFWHTPPEALGKISYSTFQGRGALILRPDGGRLGVEQLVSFPYDPFGLWVYIDSSAPTEVGLMLEEGNHQLIYRFGMVESRQELSGNAYTLYQHIESDQWVYVEIAPFDVYQSLGWELPPYQYLAHHGQLDMDLRLVNLRIFAVGTQPGYIGEIVQPEMQIAPDQLIHEVLANPADYYARLGAQHEREYNLVAALEAYRAALAEQPDNASVQAQIQRLCAVNQGLC